MAIEFVGIHMNDHLNIALAAAKQAYQELTGLASLSDLEKGEFGSDPKRGRIVRLLEQLDASINSIQRTLAEHVSSLSEAPVVSVPSPLRSFYNEILSPQRKRLQRAFRQIDGRGWLDDLFDSAMLEQVNVKPVPRILNLMSWGVEWLEQQRNSFGDSLDEWYEQGYDFEGAQSMVAKPWFQPDEWLSNMECLSPVLVDRSPQNMRDHVRYRLVEIYRAFTFGLWMAVAALCRSLVEFSLKTNAPRFGVTVTSVGVGGRTEEKSLMQLGQEVAALQPALASPIATVREVANRILHPKKRDVIAFPKIMRAEGNR